MNITDILKGSATALTNPAAVQKRAFQEMPPVQPQVDPATGMPIDPAAAQGGAPAPLPPQIDPSMDPAMAAAGMAPPPPDPAAAQQGAIDPAMPITNLTISDLLELTTQAVIDGMAAQKEEKDRTSVSDLDQKLNTILSALGLGEGAEAMPVQGEAVAPPPPGGMADPMMAGPPLPPGAMPPAAPLPPAPMPAAPMEVQASAKPTPAEEILKALNLL